jgi:predicted metalloprotease with PDZ domain
MQDELLWVYEGLTDYYGNVLTARSGMRTLEQARDEIAANFRNQPWTRLAIIARHYQSANYFVSLHGATGLVKLAAFV